MKVVSSIFSWNLIGNTSIAAIQWLIIIYLNRFTSIDFAGEYILALSLASPLFLGFGMQLRSVQVSDFRGDFSFKEYLTFKIIMLVIAFCIALILSELLYGSFAIILFYVCLAKLFEGLEDVVFGYLQLHERLDIVGKTLFAKAGFYFLAMLLLTYIKVPESLIHGVAFINFISLVFVFMYLITRYNIASNYNSSSFKNIFRTSLPLGLMIGLVTLLPNIQRYFIGAVLDVRSVSVFTSLFYMSVPGSLIINSFNQSLMTRLTTSFFEVDKKKFMNTSLLSFFTSVIIAFVSIIITIVFGEKILLLIYGKDFIIYADILNVIMLSMVFGYLSSSLGYILTSIRVFKEQLYTLIFSLIASVIVSAYLITKMGLFGAAYSMLLMYVVQAIFLGIVLWKYYKKEIC